MLASLPPMVSSRWFPQKERVTATAFGMVGPNSFRSFLSLCLFFNFFPSKVLNPLGGGVIYFLSRMVVKSKGESKRKKSPTKNTLVPQAEIQGDHLPTAPQWPSLVICSNVEFDKVDP